MPSKKATEKNMSAAENVNYVTPTNDFPFVYANNAVMSISELDGSIIFGEVVAKGEDGKTLVIPKVKVVMAIPFVHKLRELLATFPALNDGAAKD